MSNRSVDATVRLPIAHAVEDDDRGEEARADAVGRRETGVRVSRENVSPIDRNEPDAPRDPAAILPDPEMPDADLAETKRKREVRDAAAAWSLLTEDDLLGFEAHRLTLTDLVQKRYALSRGEADRQVTSFIEDHQAFAL